MFREQIVAGSKVACLMQGCSTEKVMCELLVHAGGKASFGALLHSQLVRLACGQSALSVPLLKLLCSHLRCYSLESQAQRMWVSAIAADVVDVLECADEGGAHVQYLSLSQL